jgi:hypothetical protein
MKNLNLKTQKFDRNLEGHVDSPFIEKNGLLEFNPKFFEPEFLTNSREVPGVYLEGSIGALAGSTPNKSPQGGKARRSEVCEPDN